MAAGFHDNVVYHRIGRTMDSKRKDINVLIISQHFPPEKSGNASRIHDMAVHLQSLGLNITVVAPYPTFPTGSFARTWKRKSTTTVNGVKLINLWSWQPAAKDPGFISRMMYYLLLPIHATIWALFNSSKYDVIISSAPPLFTHIPGYISQKAFGKGWIMDIRDLWIDASISLGFLKKGSFYEKISRKFELTCLQNCDAIAVTTEELGKRISFSPEIQNKIIHIANGVDTRIFRPNGDAKVNQIVYTGNVGHAQDLDKVILSLPKINQYYSVVLNIVGDGDITKNLKDLVQKQNLEDFVIFSGVQDRETIPHVLSRSLIGVAPLKKLETLEYAAPTKVYEYMSCGIPFLGCGIGEIAHIAEHSGAGIIADNTPDAISDAVLELISKPEKMEQMSRSGREYVKKHYDRLAIATNMKMQIEAIACRNT